MIFLAIQVSYTLKDEETYEREVGALKKLPKVLPCKRRSIITYDESDSISDANGNIEVLSFWKWLLESWNISPSKENLKELLNEFLQNHYNGSFSRMVCEYIRFTGITEAEVDALLEEMKAFVCLTK